MCTCSADSSQKNGWGVVDGWSRWGSTGSRWLVSWLYQQIDQTRMAWVGRQTVSYRPTVPSLVSDWLTFGGGSGRQPGVSNVRFDVCYRDSGEVSGEVLSLVEYLIE